jgi:hypothetical protein
MRPEDSLQCAVAKFLNHALPPDAYYSGVEHAQRLTVIAGSIRKAKGIKPGLSDIMVWWSGRFVAIELKTHTGTMSDRQREFAHAVSTAGFRYALCRSLDDVEATLLAEGMPLRASASGIDARRAASAAAPKPKRRSCFSGPTPRHMRSRSRCHTTT